jgi:hypothetical protein
MTTLLAVHTHVVLASLVGNATNAKTIIKAFGIAALIGFMVFAVLKSDHKGAWLAVPLVIMILIMASQGGLTALEKGGMQVWNTIFG